MHNADVIYKMSCKMIFENQRFQFQKNGFLSRIDDVHSSFNFNVPVEHHFDLHQLLTSLRLH
jgi:hypothetical protein